MLVKELLALKRDGEALNAAEIGLLVRGMVDGGVSEGQVAAFAMAVCCRGMSRAECTALTHAMRDSGTVLDWTAIAGGRPVLDKHSTGGIGDKTSLMLAPIVAAAGGLVPMISGRGLGHTGGTLDKLDAIPGYATAPSLDLLRRTVGDVGCAIIGQTDDLAPADRRLYAVRDATGTVESVALITASILSKKLAAGLGGLVLDVKTGSGAFMAERGQAVELARSLVEVAIAAGLPTTALVTDMNEPLGRTAGNALEVAEAVAYLTGAARDERLDDVTRALAAEMLVLGGLAAERNDALVKVEAVLASGAAAERFGRMVAALGGPADFIERSQAYLPIAPVIRPVPAPRPGYLAAVDARAVGLAIVRLGGGRPRAEDTVDPAVGFSEIVPIGVAVGPGRPLALVHARGDTDAEAAITAMQKAIRIADMPSPGRPLILDRLG